MKGKQVPVIRMKYDANLSEKRANKAAGMIRMTIPAAFIIVGSHPKHYLT